MSSGKDVLTSNLIYTQLHRMMGEGDTYIYLQRSDAQ